LLIPFGNRRETASSLLTIRSAQLMAT
jgi:hypothetical protein